MLAVWLEVKWGGGRGSPGAASLSLPMAREITFQLVDQAPEGWLHMHAPQEVIQYCTRLIKEGNQTGLAGKPLQEICISYFISE